LSVRISPGLIWNNWSPQLHSDWLLLGS